MQFKAAKTRYSLTEITIEIGDTVLFGSDQVYTCKTIETLKSGRLLFTWQAPCLKCGTLFELKTGRVNNGVIRTCKKHRKRLLVDTKKARISSTRVSEVAVEAGKTENPHHARFYALRVKHGFDIPGRKVTREENEAYDRERAELEEVLRKKELADFLS